MGCIMYPSYAKLNLFLHITGQRDDGYHALQTWFQFINLKDILTFAWEPSQNMEISVTSTTQITTMADNNLIVRAAKALWPYAKQSYSLQVLVDKNIPMGAGLGGGSSNAATTLIALNELYQCYLSWQQLKEIGQQLGADVPIFIHQKAAWAEGLGEIFIDKSYLSQWALVVKPPVHVETKSLFNSDQLKRNCPVWSNETVKDLTGLTNVFLPTVLNTHPVMKDYLTYLQTFSDQWRLTGTGACFFLLSDTQQYLQKIQKKINKSVDSWLVKTINLAPVKAISRNDTGL